MLKTKAIRKIFTTTLTMFIILTIFTIPLTSKNKNVIRTNLEIEDITNLSTDKIYLLNNNNLLVKVDVFLEGKSTIDKVKNIINYLTVDNNKTPSGLKPYIPSNTKVLDVTKDNETISIDFNKNFLKYSKNDEKQIITGVVYSLLELKDIKEVILLVEGSYIKNYNKPLNKSIGINNEYLINKRADLNKVVIYYLNNIGDNYYYIPVTKYLNDSREKVEIIIDELKNNQTYMKDNLISYLNNNLELLDYKEESDVFFLNFNDYLLENNANANEKILGTIANSIFSNYEVNMVMFEVNNEKVKYISRKDI